MATVVKQGKGYKITVSNGYDIKGKQIRHHMTWIPSPEMTERQIAKELKRQEVLFETTVKSGGLRVNPNITLKAFSEIYMRDHIKVNRKPNTVARYERDLKRINDGLGHLKLNQVTPVTINSFSAKLQKDGSKVGGGKLAPSSVNTILRTLSSMLGYAVRWGYIGQNPAANAEGPGQEYAEANYMDEDEAIRFLQLLQSEPIKWRALFTCDLLSGYRRGELLGLQWPDVDFEKHIVKVNRTWNYLNGKGCYFSTPKSARSKRPTHQSEAFFAVLKEYKTWQDRQKLLLGDAWKGTPEDPRIFTNEDGSPIFPTSPTTWLRRFTKAHNFKHLSPHSLRHTYASLMLANDVSVVEVSSQLGHARASTTTNIYGHVIAASHAKALATLDAFDSVLMPDKSGKH